jgi:hypothetical protein
LTIVCQSRPRRIAACLVLLGAVAGCGLFKSNEEAQATINQRVTGMAAGDFFQQFGTWRTRSEQPDGSTEYAWVSAAGPTPSSGFYGLDERTCTLRVSAGKNGRIVSADIVLDNPGRVSTSRCGEIFKAK